jgi:predicted nucleic acid-binding protein
MAIDIPRNVVVDSGYWYALFDPRDPYAAQARNKAHHIDELRILFPWPILYETLGTRFVKNKLAVDEMEKTLKRRNVVIVDDSPYREEALEVTLREARLGKRALSLCDVVIRLLIDDTNLRIHALLTFNQPDFLDVCRRKSVEIL